MNKSKQSSLIVALAIYGVMALQKIAKPARKKVLEFIRIKKLIKEREGDLDEISPNQTRLENRLSWSRKNLLQKEIIAGTKDDWGIWRLATGRKEKMESDGKKWMLQSQNDPSFFRNQTASEYEYAEQFFNLVMQIAKQDFSKQYYPA